MKGQPTPRVDAEIAKIMRHGQSAAFLRHLARRLELELSDAKLEIDVLRRFGNKDCTAMADEELSNLRNNTTP